MSARKKRSIVDGPCAMNAWTRDVEARLNRAERALAVVAVMSALARSGDDVLCLSADKIEESAWDHASALAEDAFRDLRAIHAKLPAAAHALICPDAKEAA